MPFLNYFLSGIYYLCTLMFKKYSVGILLIVFLSLTACRSEFERARQSGDPQQILTLADRYYETGQNQKAQMLYELVISDYRGKPEAEQIIYRYAYTHYNMGQYFSSAHYFKNFATTFVNSAFREEADYLAAVSHYKQSPIYRLGQESTYKTIEELQIFVNTYPQSKRVKDCNKLIDELRKKLETKAYNEAKLYFDLRQYQAALHAFENVLIDFPDTENVEKIRYLQIKSSYLLAVNSVYSKKEERFETAMKYVELFLRKYPKSKYKKEIKNIRKDIKNNFKILNS